MTRAYLSDSAPYWSCCGNGGGGQRECDGAEEHGPPEGLQSRV